MPSASNGVKLDLKTFLGTSFRPSLTHEQPLSEEQKRAELKAKTGFDKTPLERFFSDLISFEWAKTGVAAGSFGLFGCSDSLGHVDA